MACCASCATGHPCKIGKPSRAFQSWIVAPYKVQLRLGAALTRAREGKASHVVIDGERLTVRRDAQSDWSLFDSGGNECSFKVATGTISKAPPQARPTSTPDASGAIPVSVKYAAAVHPLGSAGWQAIEDARMKEGPDFWLPNIAKTILYLEEGHATAQDVGAWIQLQEKAGRLRLSPASPPIKDHIPQARARDIRAQQRDEPGTAADQARVLDALRDLDRTKPGDLFLVHDLRRRVPTLGKERFDLAVLSLARASKATIMFHDHPMKLPTRERAELVWSCHGGLSGRGTFYNAIHLRREA